MCACVSICRRSWRKEIGGGRGLEDFCVSCLGLGFGRRPSKNMKKKMMLTVKKEEEEDNDDDVVVVVTKKMMTTYQRPKSYTPLKP